MKVRVLPWISAVALLMSVLSPVVAHDGDHHGKEENGWPGSARAQEQARALLADSQPAADLAAQSATTCTDGFAGGYPCSNVDLLSFLPLADIGGGKGNDVWGWTDLKTGREYALMGRTTGTSFVDITTPSSPVYLGNLPTTRFSSTWRDIKVYKDHAFIVSESRNHGMQVFDLTRLRGLTAPVTFSADALYSGFATAHNVAINETSGFAYAIGTNTCSGGLHIVDIRTPTSPTQAGCYSGDGYTHDVQCVNYAGPDTTRTGRELCFASNEDTLTVVDVTDKSAPALLARRTYGGASYTHQGWLTDDQRYFLIDDEADEGKGFNTRTYVFDVADPARPIHIGTHVGSNPAIDHNQYIVQNHTYQANYRSGLRVLDISGVALGSLSEVAFFDIYPQDDANEFNGAWSVYPFFTSGNVVVSGIEQGLYVLKPNLGPGGGGGTNNPPVANDVPGSVAEDTVISWTPSVSDLDAGDTLTCSIATQPSNGSASVNLNCSGGSYTPDLNYNGPDSFLYRVSDGRATDDGTVTITINPVNDEPVAVDDAYTTAGGTTLSVLDPGVLANDSDVDGDPLSAVLGTGPASGSLALAADGSFTYTPDAGFHGSDSFTYTADDGTVASNVATVTITVGSEITIASLTGSSTSHGSRWTAIATVLIKDASNNPVNNATVSGSWSNGTTGTGSCVTGEDGIAGTCTIDKSGILKRVSSVNFAVTSVTHTTLTWDETQKVVTIFKP